MIQPRYNDRSIRAKNPRVARAATERRMVRKSRERYSSLVRVSIAIGVPLALFMLYVVMTSSLTGLTYAVAKAHQQREALTEETMRLDDRIAALQSDERLSAIAARLGMKDPQRIAVVRVAPPQTHATQGAGLSALAGFFMPAVRTR